MLKAALPVLLWVAVCAVLGVATDCLPKARRVGESPSTGAVPVPGVPVPGVHVPGVHVPGVPVPSVPVPGVPVAAVSVPVPDRLIVCGLPLALSVMRTEAVRRPLAEGLNVTLMVQLAPAATELPQVLV